MARERAGGTIPKMTPKRLLVVCALAMLAATPALASSLRGDAPAVAENQPRMQRALAGLTDARALLEKAEHNKGGWRVAAIAATDKAIAETKRGMAFDNKTTAADEAIALAGPANMEGALAKLREARSSLESAEHDKGGWRVAALASTDQAIKDTRRGISFGN